MGGFYKPGTRVKVINPGEQYSTYDRMADAMGLTKYVSDPYGTKQTKGNHGEIVAVKKHFKDSCYLYGVRMDNGSEILIGTGGVTVKETTSKPQSKTADLDKLIAGVKLMNAGFIRLEARVTELEQQLAEQYPSTPDRELSEGDTVEFVFSTTRFTMTVKPAHMQTDGHLNDKIFDFLAIANKNSYATTAYGYSARSGGRPISNFGDHAALARLVVKLAKRAKGQDSNFELIINSVTKQI